jgi:hypothetical protein
MVPAFNRHTIVENLSNNADEPTVFQEAANRWKRTTVEWSKRTDRNGDKLMSQAHEHHHHHDHDHAEDPYYLDQMCLVALSAMFGAVCLSLWFWRVDILKAMLADQFHPYVLVSGGILCILALLRGISLWIQVGKEPVHGDDHTVRSAPALVSLPVVAAAAPVTQDLSAVIAGDDHDHVRDAHDHHHNGHTHSHGQHGHAHAHGHAHGHGDHDHTWAPWRYVLLLVPIILFFLGLPTDAPPVKASEAQGDHTDEALMAASWIGRGTTTPLFQASALALGFKKRPGSDAPALAFQSLENSANEAASREYWAGKFVRVKGQFVPNRIANNKRDFSLARFSINCCRQDAVQLNVPISAAEDITHIKPSEWIEVTGEIAYVKDTRDVFRTVLRVHAKEDIKGNITPDPADLYINAR